MVTWKSTDREKLGPIPGSEVFFFFFFKYLLMFSIKNRFSKCIKGKKGSTWKVDETK